MYSTTINNSSDLAAMGLFGFGFAFILLYLIFLIGIALFVVFYFKTMIDSMVLIKERNREVGVSNILFLFIPFFGLYYSFVVYPKICASIQNEFIDRGIDKGGDYGRSLAIALCVSTILCLIPMVNILASIAVLVLTIVFWVKIDGFKNELINNQDANYSDESFVKEVVFSAKPTATEVVETPNTTSETTESTNDEENNPA